MNYLIKITIELIMTEILKELKIYILKYIKYKSDRIDNLKKIESLEYFERLFPKK